MVVFVRFAFLYQNIMENKKEQGRTVEKPSLWSWCFYGKVLWKIAPNAGQSGRIVVFVRFAFLHQNIMENKK